MMPPAPMPITVVTMPAMVTVLPKASATEAQRVLFGEAADARLGVEAPVACPSTSALQHAIGRSPNTRALSDTPLADVRQVYVPGRVAFSSRRRARARSLKVSGKKMELVARNQATVNAWIPNPVAPVTPSPQAPAHARSWERRGHRRNRH